MKTLDQIWQENFDILPPGTYQGSDCGNQIGGGAEPNQKPPLETLTDKFKEILQDPALSDAAKQAKLQQIIDDFGKPSGKDPYGSPSYVDPSGPGFHYKITPGRYRPEEPSTDPTSGPVNNPDLPNLEIPKVDLGGEVVISYDKDGNPTFSLKGITPSAADLAKAALAAAMAAKNAACANNKPDPNGNPAADPVTPTPTPTVPLVSPAPTPPTTLQPYRPIPPTAVRPRPGIISGRPVVSPY